MINNCKYLGMDGHELDKLGAFHTAREICHQPQLWQKIWENISEQQNAISQFLENAFTEVKHIVLTGAGTSAFIGLSLSGPFQRNKGIVTDVIPTTDLVSHPRDYFLPDIPILLVSFARSGNSPESVAALSLSNEICKNCWHLIITCNPEGDLATYAREKCKRSIVFVLPGEANDQGLAMTSSYTGMLLAGLLIAELPHLNENLAMVNRVAEYGRKIIDYYSQDMRAIAEWDFKRAVFLGSGPLKGAATEAHLKLQELTDGKIICKNDSFLGFRHGPKAVIDEATIVVYLFSNNEYAHKYEKDLLPSMKKGNRPLLKIGIMEKRIMDIDLDYAFVFSEDGSNVKEDFLPICSVLPAQILAFFKSLHLRLKPDVPSSTGAIARVVEGVRIYALND